MKPHPDKKRLDAFQPMLRQLQELGKNHGIKDVFEDDGSMLLDVMLLLNLTSLSGREGKGVSDETGRKFELRAVDSDFTTGFSTHGRLNPAILSEYRGVGWIFAIYQGIELDCIHTMDPKQLEPLFAKWEAEWHADGGKSLDNPEIPIEFVVKNGLLLYGTVPDFRARPIGSRKDEELRFVLKPDRD